MWTEEDRCSVQLPRLVRQLQASNERLESVLLRVYSFFLLANTFVEGLLFREHRDGRLGSRVPGAHKSRPSTASEGTTSAAV